MYQQGNDWRIRCPIPCPGSTCPADDDSLQECPEGSDSLGCPNLPTCRPVLLPDINGEPTCTNPCPPVCDYGQQRCENTANDPNCPANKVYSCISDNADPTACPEYCPPACGLGQVLCDGPLDGNNCPGAKTCADSIEDCPMP